MYVGHGSFGFKVSGSKLGKKDGSPKREESRLRESIHQVNLESAGERVEVELVALPSEIKSGILMQSIISQGSPAQ